MTLNELRRMIRAAPFKPFTIRMADGREYPVPHQDFLLIHPSGRTAIVATLDDDAWEIIDIFLIASLHAGNGRKPRSRRRKVG